jgi:hypothetical protein
MSNSSDPNLRYHAVHVVPRRALESIGPPLFPDRPNPEDAFMKRIAGRLNLSDTVFVFPAGQPGHFPSVSHATMRLNAGATCQR